jgi:hypothetical protein
VYVETAAGGDYNQAEEKPTGHDSMVAVMVGEEGMDKT